MNKTKEQNLSSFSKKLLTIFFDCDNILGQLKSNALLAQLDRVSGYGPEGQGFESLTARHEKRGSTRVGPFFFFVKLQKGFEQGGSVAEENSPVDCFRRRGNERSEAIARQRGTKSLTARHEKRGSTRVGPFFFFIIPYSSFIFRNFML